MWLCAIRRHRVWVMRYYMRAQKRLGSDLEDPRLISNTHIVGLVMSRLKYTACFVFMAHHGKSVTYMRGQGMLW